ncbi:MAG: YdcF family protein [Eubacteriales bacterium]|nr:YdcF family protein [Eubacteriales bacterium]MDD4541768.1 YdcF family protein [Eubacteriales bacterium]
MKRQRRRPLKILGSVLLLLLAVFLLYFFTIGSTLVREEEAQKADAIVVLLGSEPERIIEAAYLYREGFSERIIIAETLVEHQDILAEENVTVPLGAEAVREIAIQMQVPSEAVVIVPAATESTQDEALAVRSYLETETEINSILLVTSKSHSYRSSLIFERALSRLERDIELTSVPSRLDDFDSTAWYRDREQTGEVVSETIKLINFWLFERWSL